MNSHVLHWDYTMLFIEFLNGEFDGKYAWKKRNGWTEILNFKNGKPHGVRTSSKFQKSTQVDHYSDEYLEGLSVRKDGLEWRDIVEYKRGRVLGKYEYASEGKWKFVPKSKRGEEGYTV